MKFEELQTPCFIINKAELENNILSFINALKDNFVNFIFSYSLKTNTLPYILSIVKNFGGYAEVVSYDEYNLAREVGFLPNQIIYNGPMKDKETFLTSVENGGYINIETHREIDWLKDATINKDTHIGVRLNIDANNKFFDASNFNHVKSRFGFSYENGDFENIIKQLYEIGVDRIGLHLHRATKTRDIKVYQDICRYAIDVIKKLNLKIDFIDIGGGFYGNMPNKPSYGDYAQAIKTIVEKHMNINNITVIVEPGNAIIASPIDYILSVIDIKNVNNNLICVTNGSRNDIDPYFHKSNYNYEILPSSNKVTVVEQQLVGCTCIESDIITILKNEKRLNVDDKIKFKWVGAYTSTLSPNFIRLIPTIYSYEDEEYIIVRNKWQVKNWIQECIME